MRRLAVAVAAVTALALGTLAAAPAGAAAGSPAGSADTQQAAAPSVAAAAPVQGTYRWVREARVLDTRTGNGSPVMLWPGGAISVQVGGRAGVPTTQVVAVVMNLTAVRPTSDTWITAWPSGQVEPGTSNLNVYAGETRANTVTVGVGSDGKVNLRNAKGYTHLLADVIGYYSADGDPFGSYHPMEPYRLYDSREHGEAWAPGEEAEILIDVAPVGGPSAVAVNITAVSDSHGFLAVYRCCTRFSTSTVNFSPGRPTPNSTIVSLVYGEDGPFFVVYNSGGTTDVIVDVVGWYDSGVVEGGLAFTPTPPTRALDTRLGSGPVAGGTSALVPTSAVAPDAVAVVANVTGVAPTRHTWLGVSPDGSVPETSTVNLVPGETRPNQTHALVDDVGFDVHNAAGSTHVVADVFGYFH